MREIERKNEKKGNRKEKEKNMISVAYLEFEGSVHSLFRKMNR